MKNFLQSTKSFIQTHKDTLALGTIIVGGLAVFIALIALFVYNNTPKVIYQAASACDLFSLQDAQSLLGDSAVQSGGQAPTQTDHTATSRCGYTNGARESEGIIVAAVTIRSGLNDTGVTQNRVEFVKGTPTDNVEVVENLGEKAYFNHSVGQLNVLKDRDWFIFSYGVGSDPGGNTVEDATALAQKILN